MDAKARRNLGAHYFSPAASKFAKTILEAAPCLRPSRASFEAITANPVPVDLRALRAIKRSPLALDLYSLLTYQAFRAARLDRPVFMAWKQLQAALGTDYADTADLRRAVKAAMHKIQAVYLGLVIGERDGGIEIMPDSQPAIDTL